MGVRLDAGPSTAIGGGVAAADPGDQLEEYRNYLLAVAARKIRPEWRGRLAASDLVQQTMAEAAAAWPGVAERSDQQLLRWLKRILDNNLRDGVRHITCDKRAITREVSTRRSSLLRGATAPLRERPDTIAIRREEAALLDKQIDQLPETYRQAILLRHRDNCSFAEIALALGVSENAAQKLWARAIDALRRSTTATP